MIKKLLHTKIGAWLGFTLGVSGFNRIEAKKNGKIFSYSYNARTDKGAALSASLISGSSLGSISSPLPPLYIALSTSSLTPAKGDTSLTGETSVSGLGRALGTAGSYNAPSVLDGACFYTVSKTFTAGVAGPTTIVSTALFDAGSSGNLFAESNLSSSAILVLNDTLTITWTINL